VRDELYRETRPSHGPEEDEVARLVKEGLEYEALRGAERLAGLELRVMRALEERRARARRSPRRSPARRLLEVLEGLRAPRPARALAATAAALAIFALGFLVGSWASDPFVAERGVEFVIYHPEARQVSLAISYPVEGRPEWQDIPMKKRDGLWYISLQLPPGTYEYGFKIDGEWWAYDPAADYLVRSADNTVNAVREIRVGSPRRDTS